MLGQDNGVTGETDFLVKDTNSATFREDVLVESTRQPVLVDFWAPWCGPCKQIAPILERAVKAAKGKVRLVKMNIEEDPQIAGQLGIKSIPAVIAFQGGRPVDGFVGALPESQIKGFLERLIGPVDGDAEALLTEATQALEDGDAERAASLYAELLQEEPGLTPASAGLARALIAMNLLEQAKELLDGLTEDQSREAMVQSARVALDVALRAADLGDTKAFEQRLQQNPDDHDARFELALALNARGERQASADALLYIIKKHRDWEDQKARQQLLQFFEVWGPLDQDTIDARRKLSTLLFS